MPKKVGSFVRFLPYDFKLCAIYFVLFIFTLYVCVNIHISTACVPVAQGGQKGVSDPLEPELQVVVSHLLWVLRIKLKSSACALHHGTISSGPMQDYDSYFTEGKTQSQGV